MLSCTRQVEQSFDELNPAAVSANEAAGVMKIGVFTLHTSSHQHAKIVECEGNFANYLTVDEVASRLSVHPASVRRWIAAGSLKAHRVGPRAIRVASSELDAFVQPASANGLGW